MMFRQAPYGPSAARTKIVLGTAQHGLAKFSARLCSGAIETIQQQDSVPWLCLGYNRRPRARDVEAYRF
jgi:hypothetical protein